MIVPPLCWTSCWVYIYLMTVYGPMQCDEVVQGSLTGEALTLPRTSLASPRSGDTTEAKARQICFTYIYGNLIQVPEQIKVTHCLSCRPSAWPKHFPRLLHPATHRVLMNTQATKLRTKVFCLFYDVI